MMLHIIANKAEECFTSQLLFATMGGVTVGAAPVNIGKVVISYIAVIVLVVYVLVEVALNVFQQVVK